MNTKTYRNEYKNEKDNSKNRHKITINHNRPIQNSHIQNIEKEKSIMRCKKEKSMKELLKAMNSSEIENEPKTYDSKLNQNEIHCCHGNQNNRNSVIFKSYCYHKLSI